MKKTILIIEDDPFTQQFYSYLFAKEEFGLVQTEDGETAFQALENKNISLVIMDISLKNTFYKGRKYDGLELTKLIKNNPDTKNIPIILISAYKKKSANVNIFEESQADDYIVKPITDFKAFLERVRDLVKTNGN